MASPLVQVKDGKGHNYKHNYKHCKHNDKHYNYKYRGRYHYGNRYWDHRYGYRPYNWQVLGCIAAGPIWYCP